MALSGLAGRIQAHQLPGDFAHRLAGFSLSFLPVGAAHLAQRRGVATHIFTNRIKRVSGHHEPVSRLTTLRRRILNHQIFAARVTVPGHRPARELHKTPHPMVRMHHQITRMQRQGVNATLRTPRRHRLRCARRGTSSPRDLRLANESKFLGRNQERLIGRSRQNPHHAVGATVTSTQIRSLIQISHNAGRNISLTQNLSQTTRRARTISANNYPPTSLSLLTHLPGSRLKTAAIARHLSNRQTRHIRGASKSIKRPPAQPLSQTQLAHIRQMRKSRRRQIHRHLPTRSRTSPGRR